MAFMLSMGAAFLQSRSSPEGDTEFALLPLMDMVNHNSSTPVSHSAVTHMPGFKLFFFLFFFFKCSLVISS